MKYKIIEFDMWPEIKKYRRRRQYKAEIISDIIGLVGLAAFTYLLLWHILPKLQ